MKADRLLDEARKRRAGMVVPYREARGQLPTLAELRQAQDFLMAKRNFWRAVWRVVVLFAVAGLLAAGMFLAIGCGDDRPADPTGGCTPDCAPGAVHLQADCRSLDQDGLPVEICRTVEGTTLAECLYVVGAPVARCVPVCP